MQNLQDHLFNINRRQILKGAAAGGLAMLGSTALSQLMAAKSPQPSGRKDFPNLPPKAKRVIYLYQEGAPSQLDSYDHKPAFLVMISQGRGQMQALLLHLWWAGFLAGEHHGVQFRAAADPVLYFTDPRGMRREDRRKVLDMKLTGVESAKVLKGILV